MVYARKPTSKGAIRTISEGTMPLASVVSCTSREKIRVKKTSASTAPTARANRLNSATQAMGICAPVTAISRVATPGINQAGTAFNES
ncbi:hypothetical protein D3C87_1887980 [compost metagenome]